jgi:predicted PurR-regulated permease PerM
MSPRAFARYALIALGLLALALLLWKIAPVLLLTFAGIVLASALRAASSPLARRLHLSDALGVAIVVVIVIAVLGTGGYLFGQQISQQTEELGAAFTSASGRAEELVHGSPLGQRVVDALRSTTSPETMSHVAKGTATVFGAIADIALVLVLAVYLAADPAIYRRGLLLLIPRTARSSVGEALDAAARSLRRWLVGQLGAMLMVGVGIGVGLAIAGVPMAPALGILSGLFEFVPVVGPLIAAVPGVLIAFAQSPETALWAVLVYAVVQFVEGNVIMPMVQKWAVALPPALGLLGVVAFGLLFGLVGVLFAMPLMVVVVTLVNKLYVGRI